MYQLGGKVKKKRVMVGRRWCGTTGRSFSMEFPVRQTACADFITPRDIYIGTYMQFKPKHASTSPTACSNPMQLNGSHIYKARGLSTHLWPPVLEESVGGGLTVSNLLRRNRPRNSQQTPEAQ